MRTTTKKLENAVTQIKVTFDKKEWAEAQDAALKRLATRVKLDGFRPGKAPVAMIKARLGKQAIYDEATDQILQKRYADIMKKAEVAPIAQPTLNIDSVDNDNLKITILCPVKPEVEKALSFISFRPSFKVTLVRSELEENAYSPITCILFPNFTLLICLSKKTSALISIMGLPLYSSGITISLLFPL